MRGQRLIGLAAAVVATSTVYVGLPTEAVARGAAHPTLVDISSRATVPGFSSCEGGYPFTWRITRATGRFHGRSGHGTGSLNLAPPLRGADPTSPRAFTLTIAAGPMAPAPVKR